MKIIGYFDDHDGGEVNSSVEMGCVRKMGGSLKDVGTAPSACNDYFICHYWSKKN